MILKKKKKFRITFTQRTFVFFFAVNSNVFVIIRHSTILYYYKLFPGRDANFFATIWRNAFNNLQHLFYFLFFFFTWDIWKMDLSGEKKGLTPSQSWPFDLFAAFKIKHAKLAIVKVTRITDRTNQIKGARPAIFRSGGKSGRSTLVTLTI